ncbi:MAG: hypothetical protein BWY52_00041 [Chloroflexi bacterium ADurb.Bin325]|nr:MAG: hypothetical protein BWY52_00041 [Chloroflexi bacterium ADurb.Bin325]
MNDLRFNVAQLLRDVVGAARRVEVAANLYELAPELSGDDRSRVLRGAVRMLNTNAGILVQGRLTGTATLACARCLEPVTTPLEVEIEELFRPTIDLLTGRAIVPEEEDRALWIDEHHILDLTEVVRQDALLAAPLNAVCSEACRGLCPTCGQNLNEGPCDCKPEPDPRWGPLTALLDDRDNDRADDQNV